MARLTKGCVLYSDMGRILCSITEDTVGWHDPLGGCSNAAAVACKYGAAPYQQYRNHFHRNGRDSFLVEMEKWGLGPRDLTANVNFFSRVTVDEDGGMTFHPRNSMSRSHVELRAEMNVLVVGVMLVVFVVVAPDGILGLVRKLRRPRAAAGSAP